MGQNISDFNEKTILITGGAGFIGSNLAFYFQNNYPNSHVVVFDAFRNDTRFSNGNLMSFGHFNNLIGFKGDVICGNINSKNDLIKLNKYNFDYIFHHAAISDTRIYDQEIIMRTNVNSFYDILELTKNHNATLIYASSAATYGDSPSPQTIGRENPQNPYGFSKYMMDQIANRYSQVNKDIVIIGLRFFNVYGPREFYKETTSSMIIQLGHQILNKKRPKLFENSQNIFRDFIFIDDVINANIKAAQGIKSGIFNVGTGNPRSFKEIVDILQKNLKTDLEIEYIPNPYQDYQYHTEADINGFKEKLGFKAKISLEEGIELYAQEIKLTSKLKIHG
jgi:ADP-L-glycero-D-manno-heptose 6-epimerase